MTRRYALLFVSLIFLLSKAYAQKTVSGFVKDYATGEALSRVSIVDSASSKQAVSNEYGFFSIKVSLPATISIYSVGYKRASFRIETGRDSTYIFEIKPAEYQLDEVVIKSSQNDFQNRRLGAVSIPIERLNAIPTLFGEKDIFRALSLTPGISIGNEGTVGLYVRGGTPDQNLILLDEAPIYNSSHLFGIMSVFNSEALKKVEVYKSILPAEYGGRISSVIDVTMKEGNTKVRKTEHSIGLLSSTILFEGPLSYKDEDKGSYIVSGRTAYLGLVTLPLWFAYQFGNSQSYFNYLLYDINAKLNYKIDPKSRLYVSFYNSYDRWDARERYTSESRGGLNINWGNLTGTLRYNWILRPNLFFKAVVLATNYRYNIGVNTLEKIEGKFTTTEFNSLTSSLRDLTAKASVEYFKSSSHSMKVGVEATRHMYAPTGINTNFEIDQGIIEQRNRRLNANELGIFAEQDYAVQKNLTLNTGIRLNTFSVQNKAYHSFEPRLSVNWALPQEWAIKGGFTQVRQFIHLLSTNSIGLPNDIWVPATSNVPPQFARQYSVGIFKNYPSQKTVVSLEVYYKSLKDQIDFKQGTSIFANADKPWETLIEKGGIGRAYGLELFANKTEGDFTGWFGYTLAWTKSRFDNINNGNWFYGNFDRRHTVNLTGNYKVSHTVNVSSNWTFTTGRPITVPVATIQNVDFPSRMEFLYGDRNNFRMPVYHRLDLGINWERRSYKNRAITWSVGAYNVYNRINPFYLKVVGSRVALPPGDFNFRLYSYGFIPIIPYFSYAAKI